MADPASLLGTILTAVELGTKLTKTLHEIWSTWKAAPAEILAIHNEISDLNVVLSHAGKALRSAEDVPPCYLKDDGVLSDDFTTALEKQLGAARILLDGIAGSISGLLAMRRVRKRINWLKHNGEIERKRSHLRGVRLLINELLTSHNVIIGSRIELELKSVQFSVIENHHVTSAKLDDHADKLDYLSSQISESGFSPISERFAAEEAMADTLNRGFEDVNKAINKVRMEEYQMMSFLSTQVDTHQEKVLAKLEALTAVVEHIEERNENKWARQQRHDAHSHVSQRHINHFKSLRVTAQDRQPTCKMGCLCSCHSEKRMRRWRLPQGIQTLTGSLLIGYSGRPVFGTSSPCDVRSCVGKTYTHLEVSYIFPYWFWHYSLFGVFHKSIGGSPTVGLIIRPRVQWSPSSILHAAEIGAVDLIRSQLMRNPESISHVLHIKGESALHLAVGIGHVEATRVLLQAGANPDQEDDAGESAGRMLARRYLLRDYPPEKLRAFEELIPLSRYLDDMDLSPISQIILGLRGGNIEDALMSDPSTFRSINDVDDVGNTPLLWAVPRGNLEAVRLLLRFGADPNVRDARQISVLTRSLANDDSARCFDLLLKYGARIAPEPDMYGMQPVHWAAARGRVPELRKLIASGADVNARVESDMDICPLVHAVIFGQVAAAEYLLDEAGADMDQETRIGYTPLLVSVQDNSHDCMRLLLARGADYKVRTSSGMTLLHMAARCGDAASMDILAEHGLAGVGVDLCEDDEGTAAEVFERRGSDSAELKKAFEQLLEAVASQEKIQASFEFEEEVEEEVFHDTLEWIEVA